MNLPLELKRALENDKWRNFFKENALLHSREKIAINEEMCLKSVVVPVGCKRVRE
jgi:hypothetical protein